MQDFVIYGNDTTYVGNASLHLSLRCACFVSFKAAGLWQVAVEVDESSGYNNRGFRFQRKR